MYNLEQAISAWRRTLTTALHVEPETLDELENHLRESVEQLVSSGTSRADAFQQAVKLLGPPEQFAAEFAKLASPSWWPAKAAKALVAVIGVVITLAVIWGARTRGWDILLSAHVITVALGFTTALLLGALGICFVCQRCLAEFPSRRLNALQRDSVAIARISTSLIAVGVVLGMVWTKREWGRFWDWDPKEIGGLAILLWLTGLLVAHSLRRITPRAFLLSSILGGNIAGLAYFGPGLLTNAHHFGSPLFVGLLVFEVLSLLVCLVGLAPAGWLRFRSS
jgi:hypothetical protein